MTDWTWWQSALAGNNPEAKEGDIRTGFFRTRRMDPVAIWQDESGAWLARVGDKTLRKEPDISDLFATCCRSPVTYENYKARLEGKPWPDETALPEKEAEETAPVEQQPAGIGHNSGSTLDQIVADMAEWQSLADQTLRAASGTITDQATADKMSDIANKFGEFETQAKAEHKAEKEPHLIAGRKVDEKWKPVIERADAAKRAAKVAVGVFLKAEKDRLAEAVRLAAETAGVSENVVTVAAPRAGAKRAVVLKTHKFVVITDLPKAAAFFAAMADPPAEFKELVSTLALRVITAGVPVPGAELKSEQRAA